jgi:hypothetical protein
MAVMQVAQATDRETYEAVMKVIDFEHDRPTGCRFQAAGELPDGRMRIVVIWESQEDSDNFYLERLAPAFREVGVDDSGDGPPETVELLHQF